jgi:hypothetical protein
MPLEHTIRQVDYNTKPGSQFDYFCDGCSLHLRGFYNKHYEPSVTGWTWVLTRENTGEEVATAGNKLVQTYGGTEDAAREDGLKRFNAEPCLRPN